MARMSPYLLNGLKFLKTDGTKRKLGIPCVRESNGATGNHTKVNFGGK
ncbi:hypothetical protein UACE39S_00030 [Ureibacillus acetophenoni]